MVSNPNKKGNDGKKKSSFFSSLLGFFYNHTKKILTVYLSLVVILSFVFAFIRELDVYKQIRFSTSPLEIMFISITYSIFDIIKYFVPVLLIVLIIKYFMIRRRKIKLNFIFRKSFKRQTLIAFTISFVFAVIFYFDVLLIKNYSRQLVESSLELFVLFFLSILFTMSSMYGLVKGVSPILKLEDK